VTATPTFDPEWCSFAVERLDQIRAELSDIAGAMPLSDAQMCVLSAKDSLALAQDLIEDAVA